MAMFAATLCDNVRVDILVSRAQNVSPPCSEGREQIAPVYRPSFVLRHIGDVVFPAVPHSCRTHMHQPQRDRIAKKGPCVTNISKKRLPFDADGRGEISAATWFSTPHQPKGRISAARLCSSNGKYASPGASTTECELKLPSGGNETVVTRVKKAARETYLSLEYIRRRPGGGTRTAQHLAGEPDLNFRREKGRSA